MMKLLKLVGFALMLLPLSLDLVSANSPAPAPICVKWNADRSECLQWDYLDSESGLSPEQVDLWIYGGALGGLTVLGGIGIHYIRKNHAS